MRQTFSIRTREKRQTIDVTSEVRKLVRGSGAREGLCHVMVLHATAAIVINENDDPNIGVDLLTALDGTVPEHGGWLHDRIDGNAQAHILAATLGPSETIAIEGGDLVLGRWQGIMLVELDGPRERQVSVTVLPTR
ncbi:MAG: secondary thiamine-phosphate synthase enzyme YjbQ [Candidatus Binatia bacterium]